MQDESQNHGEGSPSISDENAILKRYALRFYRKVQDFHRILTSLAVHSKLRVQQQGSF